VGGDPSQFDLQSWIDAARRGDRQALGQAMLSFRDYLLLVANTQVKPALQSKGGASDLVQETFFRAHLGFEKFRGSSAVEWRGWLRKILIRQSANHRRRYGSTNRREIHRELKANPEFPYEPVDGGETPSRDLARREREQAVIAAVTRLPERYRAVVIEHNRDKLPFDEIGRRRGISDEAARKLWSRALVLLKKELGPTHDSR
jgi:RNA polymerase sigma-70 factor (ECF subfamily)